MGGNEEMERGYPHVTKTIFGDLWEGLMDVNHMIFKGLMGMHFFPEGNGARQFMRKNTMNRMLQRKDYSGPNGGDDSEWSSAPSVCMRIHDYTCITEIARRAGIAEIAERAKIEELRAGSRRARNIGWMGTILLLCILGGTCFRAGAALEITTLTGAGYLMSCWLRDWNLAW